MTGDAEHRLHGICVKAPGLDVGPKLDSCVLGRALGPVGTRLAHRLVGVGCTEDPSRARDCRAGEPARVAGAVEALSVLYRDRAQRREHR